MPWRGSSSSPARLPGGPCIAMVVNDDGGEEEECGVCTSSYWYGKGKTFCASHRAAWNKSKAQVDDAADPSYISEMDDVLGP